MSRRAAAFTQADVRRALKAAQMASPGVQFAVEVGEGRALIFPVDPTRWFTPAAIASAPLIPAETASAPLADPPKWSL